jgi:hypothetical protein
MTHGNEQLTMCARATRRTNFHVFLRDAFKVTHPRKQLSEDPYLEALSFALETAATEPAGRLMVTMPPRYLKSFAASIALVAWILGRDPACKVIVASYADGLAKEQARIPSFRAHFIATHSRGLPSPPRAIRRPNLSRDRGADAGLSPSAARSLGWGPICSSSMIS